MLERTGLDKAGLASARPVLYRAAVPTVAASGFPGEGCCISGQRATGAQLEGYGISITDARSGVVEADHFK
jgi:hypothetical protein